MAVATLNLKVLNLAGTWVTLSSLKDTSYNSSGCKSLSGCHSALKGVRDETDGIATGDPEDEI